MSGRQVVVDGSNIATEGRSLPSLQQLDEAVRAFIKERTDDDHVVVVVDATFEHRIDRAERTAYREGLDAGELITPPAGTIGRGDKFILEIADKTGAVVLSNDSFQEFQDEYEWLFDEGRLVGGKPVPGVGWIFTARSPVRATRKRGAAAKRSKSKKQTEPAVAEAAPTAGGGRARGAKAGRGAGAKGDGQAAKGAEDVKGAKAAGDGAGEADGKARRRSRRGGRGRGAKAESTATPPAEAGTDDRGATGRRGGRSPGAQVVNGPLPFIEFVADHPIGATVEGEVTAFSSHGAHAVVDGVQCYVPLKLMAEPAPNRARDLLEKGETRTFVVVAFDSERRGVDLGLPGVPGVPDAVVPAARAEPVEERQRKATVKKAPAKKAAARKGAARKAAAKKAAAEQAPADERTARQAAVKKTAIEKVTPRKAAAKRAPARKAPAKKAPTKRAPARKAAAKKAPTKRAPAKKGAAKKAPAKRAPAKRAPAKKGAAKKAAAKKAAAKKGAAKKAAARKATRRAT